MFDIRSAVLPILRRALTWLSRRRLPKVDGELSLPGLQTPVKVCRDRWGVPHIYADNLSDLYIAQGFIHAQDRLWQMEVNRRLGAGRLAEVLGPAAVETDRHMRTLTIRLVAEQEADLLSPEPHAALEAYAAGVNAYIQHGRLPVEFTILRHKPEPWTPVDTLTWAKIMAWFLCVDWKDEAHRGRLVEHLGAEKLEQLNPPYLSHWPHVIPPGSDLGPQDTLTSNSTAGSSSTNGWGSNNWVVGGARTSTGSPILANDMHLGMSIPAIWYENHLACGDLDVTGVTFPGTPGVVSGHNGHVAWGFTDGLPDVQDLYMEHLRHTDDGRIQVEYEGGWYEATLLREVIYVKRGEPVHEDVIVTRHGPIVNALLPNWDADQPLALRWTALEPDTMLESFLSMNRAQTCAGFRDALRGWAAPVQNVVYADIDGNIGYSFPGKIPIRSKSDGRTPVPGWTNAYEWQGYIPFDELPHLDNPPQSYIASANNAVVADAAYPHDLAVRPGTGNRAERIVELIESRPTIDIEFIKQMHIDVLSPMARRVSHLVGALDVDEPLAPVVALLAEWDGNLSLDSAAGAVYEVFIREMATLLLSDTSRQDRPYHDSTWWWLEHIFGEPRSPWFDLGNGETRDDVMRMTLAKTVRRLEILCGPAPEDWAWGDLNKMTYGHTLGDSPTLGPLFNRGPFSIPGDTHTVCAAHHGDLTDLSISGAPYRMIVDLGDVRNSVSSLTPGQSGHLGSPHYDDQIAPWSAGEYHPMLFAREDIEREARHRLHLIPKSPAP